MRIRSLLLAAVAALGLSSAAQAALVTFNYTGEITSASDSAYLVGQNINVSVTLNLESPLTQLQNSGASAAYFSFAQSAVQSIVFGSNSVTADGFNFFGQAQIHNNAPYSGGYPPGPLMDLAYFTAANFDNIYADLTFAQSGANPTALASVALPASFLDPSLFGLATARYQVDGLIYTANLSAVSAVPEPATWALMILGFAAMGFVGYRRSRKLATAAA